MIEKVKLTREQAVVIELIRGDTNKGLTPGNIRTQLKKQWRDKPYATLNELPFEQFIVAVLGDYEVKETFKVGDWVVDRRSVYKIISKHHADYLNKEVHPEVRHAPLEEIAEEKQRRWWAKHGREVWELRKGDVISDDDGEFHEVSNNNENEDGVSTMSGGFNQTYLEKYSKVICFAEDRKDIDGGDIE